MQVLEHMSKWCHGLTTMSTILEKLKDVMANVDFTAISEIFSGGGMTWIMLQQVTLTLGRRPHTLQYVRGQDACAPCHGGAYLNSGLLTASSIQPLHLHIIWQQLQILCRWSWMCCALHIRSLAVGNTCFVMSVKSRLLTKCLLSHKKQREHSWMDSEWQTARKYYICMFDAEGNIIVKLKMNYTDRELKNKEITWYVDWHTCIYIIVFTYTFWEVHQS